MIRFHAYTQLVDNVPLYGAGIAIAIIVLAVTSTAVTKISHYGSVISSEYNAYQSLEIISAIHSSVAQMGKSCTAGCIDTTLAAICRADMCLFSGSNATDIIWLRNSGFVIWTGKND